ncbi:phage major capsid protein [Pseudoclavibacter helvolus]|uniref:phage major capsid protein n=1 Tax=Pseudoclavibacter helvolus TaxID=255205 RepID=UPI00373595C4
MTYTYPVAHPTGTLTKEQLHLFLANKQLIARRLADLTKMKFIADWLLQGRFDATGGGIFYETGEPVFASDDPEAIAPLGEYPLVVLEDGTIASAKTDKWGLDTIVSDEKIARQGRVPVDRGILRVGNSIIRYVDRVAMAVIASRVSSTFTSAGTWTTAGNAVESILTIQAERSELGLGFELDTVVLRPAQYARIIGMLIDDKALPRESGETAIQGNLPVNALGLTWATTPHFQGANPLLVDRDNLGGMADEKLGGPGYASAGDFGVEAKSIRDDDTEGYKLRGRRVTVPVVTEPLAGVQLLGTGLS